MEALASIGPGGPAGDPRKEPPRREPPGEEPMPEEPPREDPPTEEPPHKDPPPHEAPRRDPSPEVPVIDPPREPTLPEPPAEVRNRARLLEILSSCGTALMVTRAADGMLHHRPVSVARIDDDALYFVTTLEAAQIVELTADPRIDVIVRGRGVEHAAIVGTAEISRDRGLIDRLWTVALSRWFPGGATARDLAVVTVRPSGAEYWDAASGLKGVVVQLGAVA